MEKQETENFTIRLTKEDRSFLNMMAGFSGVSSGKFMTQLLRREIVAWVKDIALQIVLCKVAEKYGVPASVAEHLKNPAELSGIMEPEKFKLFCDEVMKQADDQCAIIEEKYKPNAEDYNE